MLSGIIRPVVGPLLRPPMGRSPVALAARLTLDFLAGFANPTLRTTRSGLATCIGPDGTTQWGPHNLCGESNTLLGWGASLLANSVPLAAAAFDGGQYAMQANTVTGTLNFSKVFTSADTKMSMSVDVQRGNFDTGNGAFTYGFYNSSTLVDLAYITVNYATGAVALTGPQAATSIAYSKDLGNGWFRIGITVTSGIAPGQTINTYLGGVGSPSSAGLFWRMARVMVNNGTSMDYVDSTVKNRLGYSNDFTNAAWVKTGSTVYEKTCTGPTGQPASTLVSGQVNAQLTQSVTISGVCTAGLLIRRRLGTGAISLRASNGATWIAQNLTGDWTACFNDSGKAASASSLDILMAASGDQIDICDARLVPGTGTPTLGDERITTTPTANNGWTPVGTGGVKVAGGATGSIYGAYGAFGSPYRMTVVVAAVSGTLTPQLGSTPLTPITVPGTYTYDVTPTAGAYFYVDGTAATTANVTSVSVKPITYGPIPYSYNAGPAPAVGPLYAQRTDYDVSTVSGIGPSLVTGTWTLNAGDQPTYITNVTSANGVVTATSAGGLNSGYTATQVIPTVVGKMYLAYANTTTTNPSGTCGLGATGTAPKIGPTGGGPVSYPFVATTTATTFTLTIQPNALNGTVSSHSGVVVQEAFAGSIAGYGPDRVVNGDFASGAAGWVNSAASGVGWASITTAGATISAGSSGWLMQTAMPATIGAQYLVTVAVAGTFTGSVALAGEGFASNSLSILGTQTFPVTAKQLTGLRIWGNLSAGSATVALVSVKEIQFASRGALIEPTQVTQLLANPDDLSASPWTGAVSATNDGTKFRGRPMWKLAKTLSANSEPKTNSISGTQPTGYSTQRVAFLASSNSTQADFGLLGGTSTWGNAGDATCVIESGPGVVTQQAGALWRVTGLSTNVPTVISQTRNLLVSETLGLYVYPDTSVSTTIGKAVYFQTDGLVAGTSMGSFIPNPATSGSLVRVADTSSVGYDDLVKALPWLMDTNLLADPEGTAATLVTDSGVTTAATTISGYANSIQFPASNTLNAAYRTTTNAASTVYTFQCVVQMDDNSAPVVGATSAIGDFSVQANNAPQGGIVTPLGGGAYLVTCTYLSGGWTSCGIVRYVSQSGKGFRVTAMKNNPGPVAQTYYPQSSKQGTIVFEGDLTYGSTAAVLFCLENTVSNRVLLYKPTAVNTLYGYINGNGVNSNQVITSGVPFKAAIGFSLASAGIAANGSSEAAITPGAFALAPNVLKIANDATNGGSGSVHLRRLRIFNTNLPASTKQALTR